MGAFSNVDYELQNNEAAVSNAFMEDDDMDMAKNEATFHCYSHLF